MAPQQCCRTAVPEIPSSTRWRHLASPDDEHYYGLGQSTRISRSPRPPGSLLGRLPGHGAQVSACRFSHHKLRLLWTTLRDNIDLIQRAKTRGMSEWATAFRLFVITGNHGWNLRGYASCRAGADAGPRQPTIHPVQARYASQDELWQWPKG